MEPSPIRQTIELLSDKIRKVELDLVSKKKTVNELAAEIGDPIPYPNIEQPSDAVGAREPLSDEFYGQPLAKVVRTILENRKKGRLGAAPVQWIYEMMVKGGYNFHGKSADAAIHGLSTSLAKNTAVFHRLPKGDYGLREWYPEVPKKKANGTKAENADAGDDTSEDDAESFKENFETAKK